MISTVKYETKSSAKSEEGGCVRVWGKFERELEIVLKNEK